MLHSFPTRRSSDLVRVSRRVNTTENLRGCRGCSRGHPLLPPRSRTAQPATPEPIFATAVAGPNQLVTPHFTAIWRITLSVRSEEHTSELQSLRHLVCYTLSLHDALPILCEYRGGLTQQRICVAAGDVLAGTRCYHHAAVLPNPLRLSQSSQLPLRVPTSW